MKDDKRTRILDAAERLFVERGSARASTKRIAAAADVAEGTIYLYFENKSDLLFHVFLRSLREADGRFAGVARPEAPVAENLGALGERAFSLLVEKSRLRILFDREVGQLPESMRHRLRGEYERLEDRFVSAIDWGKGRGEVRGDLDSRTAAHAFMAILERTGLLLVPSSVFAPIDPAEGRRTAAAILAALPSLLLEGIRTRPAP